MCQVSELPNGVAKNPKISVLQLGLLDAEKMRASFHQQRKQNILPVLQGPDVPRKTAELMRHLAQRRLWAIACRVTRKLRAHRVGSFRNRCKCGTVQNKIIKLIRVPDPVLAGRGLGLRGGCLHPYPSCCSCHVPLRVHSGINRIHNALPDLFANLSGFCSTHARKGEQGRTAIAEILLTQWHSLRVTGGSLS